MKKKINKILYSGLFIGAFSLISASCSNNQNVVHKQEPKPVENNTKQEQPKTLVKNNEETKVSTPVTEQSGKPTPQKTQDNYIDLSKGLFQLSDIPLAIVKDLYKNKSLTKLSLVPNSTSNSIDLELKINKYDESINILKNNEFLNTFLKNENLRRISELNFLNNLFKIKIGELIKGTDKDQIFVQDKAENWVKLDLSKQDQFLPIKLDKDNNFVLEYKIQKEGSKTQTDYAQIISLNNKDKSISKSVVDSLANYAQKNSFQVQFYLSILKQFGNTENLFKNLLPQSLRETFAKSIDSLDQFVKKFTELSSDFFKKLTNKEITNESLTNFYFETQKIAVQLFSAFSNDIVNLVVKIKSLKPEEIKNKIAKLKENIDKLKTDTTKETKLVKTISGLLKRYEDPALKDEVIIDFSTLESDPQLKLLGISIPKAKNLTLKVQDILLIYATFSMGSNK
ncbi:MULTISPECIES: hypothetical protein [unclassified Mycoplasma]|uniref:hypothetical protein n=1 Tax=unclassified Mycoplasma TaxID=2683645 RepID=UPI00211C4D37|nr:MULTISPECIES: hypothetical protein [unclassified Mycoplasma]UUM19672.1 hypothetical protein NPA11_02790 [Mycoplasma sp. 1578d]UUM24655.1 hypothetical protein NPA12_03085 [Mycoplasma sp. 3686d]